jgi:L-histidine N-alpha-methyltransferase
MSFRDFLLIGFDSSHKDKEIILRAYNDEKGVTRDFILNILTHIKREFLLELDEKDFDYEGIYNEELERMEMYVTPNTDTCVRINKGNFYNYFKTIKFNT